MTDEEIERQSVLEVTNSEELLSNKLGSTSKQVLCQTCNQYYPNCPGHQGYMKAFPYYTPIMQNKLMTILQKTCTNCLRYNPERGTKCIYCLNKLNTFECVTERKALLYVKINKESFISLCKKFNIDLKSSQNEYILHPYFVQQIIEAMTIEQSQNENNQIQNDNQLKLEEKDTIPLKSFLQVVHKNIPIISQQQRVSQPQLGEINFLNNVYQKIFRQQITLQEIFNNSITSKGPSNTTQKADPKGPSSGGDMPIYMKFKDNTEVFTFTQYNIIVYLLMSSDSDPVLQQQIGLKSTNQLISLLSKAQPKKGLFRGYINSVRVGCSCRTVVGGNPYLNCDQVTCPQMIAESITVPLSVNVQNFKAVIDLINNFPNYPCVKYILPQKNTSTQINYIKINNSNKDTVAQQLLPGDIVYRQLLENDTTLTNRYPSLQEESFGMHKIHILPVKQIQFNMSVIDKMNADFDGDEMQLFLPYTYSGRVENILLQSTHRQFITYESGLNLIGGAKDLKAGIFNLQNNIKLFQKDLDEIIPKNMQDFSFDGITISKGHFIDISTDLANSGSSFLTQVCKQYGPTTAINFIDGILKICYKANEICGSTLYTNIFNINKSESQKLTLKQREEQLKLIDSFYNGTFNAPIGVDPKQYFEQYVIISQSFGGMIQMQTLLSQLKIKDLNYPSVEPYYNKIIEKQFSDQMRTACLFIGQKKNHDGTRITNSIRVFPSFKKFYFVPETQGYIYGCYAQGMSGTEIFYENIEGRRQLYDKTNSTPEVGYISRRLAKGLDQIYMQYSGIVYSNQMILSLGYNMGNYDPRWYIVKSLKEIFQMSQTELNKKYSSSPLKEETLQLIQDLKDIYIKGLFYPEQVEEPQIIIPFEWDKEVSTSDLNLLLSFNLCGNQTPLLQDAIISKNKNLYNYFLLFNKIVKSTKHDEELFQLIQNSQCPAGEQIGQKAAFSIGHPITQLVLDSIHSKAGGATAGGQIINVIETGKHIRVKELIDHLEGVTVFTCELLPGYSEEEFIKKYNTYYLKDFNPSYQYYLQNDIYTLEITIPISELAHNDINFKKFLSQIDINYTSLNIDIKNNQYVVLSYGFNYDIIELIPQIQDMIFGSNLLFNLYIEEITPIINQEAPVKGPSQVPTKRKLIKGNINNIYKLYQFQEIDPDSIYISEPDIPEFGIFYMQNKIYKEFVKCAVMSEALRPLEKSHFYIISQQLTIQGFYGAFGRNFYKKDQNRSLLQNIVYEESTFFIQQQLLQEKLNHMSHPLDAQTFGTKSQAGTDISEIYLEI